MTSPKRSPVKVPEIELKRIDQYEDDSVVDSRPSSARLLSPVDSEKTKTPGPLDGNVAEVEYRVYKSRWLVLGIASLLNMANTISWLAFSPVANYTDQFYVPQANNILSMMFLGVAIPVAFFAMWSESRYGLRLAFLLAAWANGIGATIRLISSLGFGSDADDVRNVTSVDNDLGNTTLIGNITERDDPFTSQYRFIVVAIGQGVTGCAYPFIMFLPTRIAASWFPENQRAIANSMATMANPMGVLIANVCAPQMVRSVEHILLLNIFTFIPSIAATVLATVVVRSSAPPTPPTKSAAAASYPFFAGLKRLVRSRAYWLLFLMLGCGIGMFNCLYTLMQQILCAKGYSNMFSGVCSILMVVGGVFGAFGSGIIIDKTKKFEEVLKIAFALSALMGIAYAETALHANMHAVIAIACTLLGMAGIACYPNGLEMSAEMTFPVAPSTSSGIIIVGGQIWGVILIIIMGSLGQPASPQDLLMQTCSVGTHSKVHPKNMMLPLMVFCSIGAVLVVFFIIFFKPKYRRLQMEHKPKAPTNSKEGEAAQHLVPA